MDLVAADSRRRPSAVTPSKSGSWMPSRITSGTCFSARASPAAGGGGGGRVKGGGRGEVGGRVGVLVVILHDRERRVGHRPLSRDAVGAEPPHHLDELDRGERRLGRQVSNGRVEALAILSCDA